MTHSDDEFAAFLKRRKPLFRDVPDELFEPPQELDRIVLRQANEAIKGDIPQRVYQAPRWGAPLAVAATVVLAFTIIMNVNRPAPATRPDITLEKVARRIEIPAAAAAPAPVPPPNYPREASAGSGPVVVELGASAAETERAAVENLAPAAQSAAADSTLAAPVPSRLADSVRGGVEPSTALRADSRARSAEAAQDKIAQFPWRRDVQSWLQEIDRLRDTGEAAHADLELAEFHRQHPTFGAAPDAPDR